MSSEHKLLRQQVGDLEAENAKLKQLIKPKVPSPPTQGDSSIEEYFRMFEAYITCLGVSPDSEFAKEQFINGLTAESKAKFPVTNEVLPYISYLVMYLSGAKEK